MFKLTLTGNIGKDPELRTSKTGGQFYTTSVAVSTGKDQTQWVDLIIKSDNKTVPYITKGMKVLVEGKPSVNNYTTRDGVIAYSLSCSVFTIEPMNKKEDNSAPIANNSSDMAHDDIPF